MLYSALPEHHWYWRSKKNCFWQLSHILWATKEYKTNIDTSLLKSKIDKWKLVQMRIRLLHNLIYTICRQGIYKSGFLFYYYFFWIITYMYIPNQSHCILPAVVVVCPLIIITHPMSNMNLNIFPHSDVKTALGMLILKQI